MAREVILTGIKPTGMPHLGNLVGAIQPSVELSQRPDNQAFYFIADYHALTGLKDAQEMAQYSRQIAAAWIALGLDPERVILYRQSDIPEVFELNWILACFAPKGLMNRAHAYKAATQKNQENGDPDLDAGVNMGLYTYPVLMAADILLMQTRWVPVGGDQVQHIEIARDLAQYFNRQYQREVFTLPDALIDEAGAVIPGLDGRKMSKSYGNTIPIFAPAATLQKLVARIATDSTRPGEPKDPDKSTVFQLYRLVATTAETESFRQAFLAGIAWKDAKDQLYEVLNRKLSGPRERYYALLEEDNRKTLDQILAAGVPKARQVAAATMKKVRKSIGVV